MKNQIIENFAIQLTVDATSWAMKYNQVVGEDREYFITLRQLERFLNMQEEAKDREIRPGCLVVC